MLRIQKNPLLIGGALVALLLVGCTKSDEFPTVAEYIHDLDSAKAMLQKARNSPDQYGPDHVGAMRASKAFAESMSPGNMECWPVKPASSATTDHACLDGKGFKR